MHGPGPAAHTAADPVVAPQLALHNLLGSAVAEGQGVSLCKQCSLAHAVPCFVPCQVAAVGSAPPPRHGHLLLVHNDLLYLFGGVNDLGVTTATLFRAVLSRQQVDRACASASAAAFGDAAATVGGDGDQQAAGAQGDAGGLAVGANSTAAVLQLEWQELEADLPYNKSRATVMQQGQIRCYQLGSATLGRSINEDDAEKGSSAHQAILHHVLDHCTLKAVQPCRAQQTLDGCLLCRRQAACWYNAPALERAAAC